jgi:hypothetical protein
MLACVNVYPSVCELAIAVFFAAAGLSADTTLS